jgi:hypothetical protein
MTIEFDVSGLLEEWQSCARIATSRSKAPEGVELIEINRFISRGVEVPEGNEVIVVTPDLRRKDLTGQAYSLLPTQVIEMVMDPEKLRIRINDLFDL